MTQKAIAAFFAAPVGGFVVWFFFGRTTECKPSSEILNDPNVSGCVDVTMFGGTPLSGPAITFASLGLAAIAFMLVPSNTPDS